MKKSIKLITLILMSLAFSVAANAETNEKCGENISWEICDDGKLIIKSRLGSRLGTYIFWYYFSKRYHFVYVPEWYKVYNM